LLNLINDRAECIPESPAADLQNSYWQQAGCVLTENCSSILFICTYIIKIPGNLAMVMKSLTSEPATQQSHGLGKTKNGSGVGFSF
jgi:hypothetical protein